MFPHELQFDSGYDTDDTVDEEQPYSNIGRREREVSKLAQYQQT